MRTLVRHFEEVNVGAVAGNAKVGNRVNLLTRWQALEYITSQNLDRRYGSLGFVAFPNIVIFQVLFPLITPLMDLLVVLSIGT
jgi:cellulose synthase/poly-beta-1,6-N-acetylglucosamine synthase-like glycosyltransferase